MAASPEEQMATMAANLKANTGKTLDQCYMSLRRSTQFATLHSSTKTRFDVGRKLKGVAPAGRLEAAGSWNGMVTHRVRLESVADVDKELIGWLRQAYMAA